MPDPAAPPRAAPRTLSRSRATRPSCSATSAGGRWGRPLRRGARRGCRPVLLYAVRGVILGLRDVERGMTPVLEGENKVSPLRRILTVEDDTSVVLFKNSCFYVCGRSQPARFFRCPLSLRICAM